MRESGLDRRDTAAQGNNLSKLGHAMQGTVWYGKASLGAVRRGKLRQGFDFMDRPCDARQRCGGVWEGKVSISTRRVNAARSLEWSGYAGNGQLG